MLIGGLDRAFAATASLRAAVAPHEIVAAPGDAGIQPVDVLAAGRLLGRELFEDGMELVRERLWVRDALGQPGLEARGADLADCGRDVECVLVEWTREGVDGLGRGRGEAAGDACGR